MKTRVKLEEILKTNLPETIARTLRWAKIVYASRTGRELDRTAGKNTGRLVQPKQLTAEESSNRISKPSGLVVDGRVCRFSVKSVRESEHLA